MVMSGSRTSIRMGGGGSVDTGPAGGSGIAASTGMDLLFGMALGRDVRFW